MCKASVDVKWVKIRKDHILKYFQSVVPKQIDGLKKTNKIMDPTAIGIQCKCSVKYSV